MKKRVILAAAYITAMAAGQSKAIDRVNDSSMDASRGRSIQVLLAGVAGRGSDRTVRKEIAELLTAHDISSRSDRAGALSELGFACDDKECRVSAENRGELKGPNWSQSLTRIFEIRVGYHETPMKIDVKHSSVRRIPDNLGNSPLGVLIYREGPFASDNEFSEQVKRLLLSERKSTDGWAAAMARAAGFECADVCNCAGSMQLETVADSRTESHRYRYEVTVNITTDPPVVTAKQTQD